MPVFVIEFEKRFTATVQADTYEEAVAAADKIDDYQIDHEWMGVAEWTVDVSPRPCREGTKPDNGVVNGEIVSAWDYEQARRAKGGQ